MDLNGKIKLFGAFADVVVRLGSNVSGFIGVPKVRAEGLLCDDPGGLVR